MWRIFRRSEPPVPWKQPPHRSQAGAPAPPNEEPKPAGQWRETHSIDAGTRPGIGLR